MPISPGARLGSYEVLSPLGAGGTARGGHYLTFYCASYPAWYIEHIPSVNPVLQ